MSLITRAPTRSTWRHPGRLRLTIALIVAVGGIIGGSRAAMAQNAGVVAGHVTDAENRAPLEGVTVLVTGTLLRAATNAAGEYRITGMSPGTYRIRVLHIGYRDESAAGVAVAAGEPRTLDFALRRAPVELSDVVVTATKGETRPRDVAASVSTLGRSEILDRSAIRLNDALPFVPGVVFNGGDIDIRGSTGVTEGVGSRVLVLLDGHPVLSADGAEVDFEAVPLLDVDRAEIVKGAYSALYGGNALGGVVNIITTSIAEKPQTLFNVHYGAFDTPSQYRFTDEGLTDEGFELQHSRRIGPVGARFAVGREASTGFEQDAPLDQWLVRTKVMYPADAAHPSTLYAVWSNERSGNFFSWLNPAHPYAVDPHHARDFQWYDKVSVGGTIVPWASQRASVRVEPFIDYNNSRNNFYEDTLSAYGSLVQKFHPVTAADSTTLRGAARSDTFNLAFHRAAKFGANAQISVLPGARQSVIAGVDESATSIQADALAAPAELHDLGVYAQDEVALLPAWTATVGARIDSHSAVGPAETTVNPKVGLVYRASTQLSMRASVNRGYRAPSAIEQFVDQYQQNVHVVPNDTLRGETAWSSEIGAREDLGGAYVDAAVFESDYHNLIEPAPAAGLLFQNFQFQNTTSARIRGLDAGGKVGLIPDRLALSLSYLYLDTQNLTRGVLYDTPLPYRSKHNVTGSVDLFRGLAGVDLRYRSRVERTDLDNSAPRTPITLVDLRLGYRVRGVTLRAKVSNLLQAHYVNVLENIPGAPRSLLLTALKEL
jgi:outer membrane receptor for ferrienterochelin and colicins